MNTCFNKFLGLIAISCILPSIGISMDHDFKIDYTSIQNGKIIMSEQNEKNVEILIEDIENHDELWGIRRQYPKALFDLERLFILVEINSQYKLEAITRDYPNTLFDKENSIALIPRKKDIPSSGWTFNRSLLFCGLICLQQCIKTESSPKTTTP